MAEQGKEHKLTQADYNDNLNELYKVAKVAGVTKIPMADFSNKMITSPGYRGLIYEGLKKAGVEGLGDNQSDFVAAILPRENAVAQVALYNENKAKKAASSTPKAKQTQQAAEVGQTMFGGGEETTALQQAQQQVQQIQQANKETQGQTMEHLDNPQMQSLFGYKNMSNSRVVNDESLWDENGMLRRSGQPSIEEGERKAKENIGNVYESLVNGKGTRIDEKGNLRSNDPLAALQQERSDRKAKALDVTREEVKNTVGSVMADADKEFFDRYKSLVEDNHLDETAAIAIANQEISPEKVLEDVRSKVSENAMNMIKSNMATYEKAAQNEGITTEEYIDKYVMPELATQVEQEFDKAQIARYMPENAGEYIFEGVLDSVTGMIANMGVTTPEQRQYQQRAAEEAREKYGTAASIARVGTSFATDPFVFKGTGAFANNLLGKVGLGTLEKTIGKTAAGRFMNFANANLSGAEKFAARASTGIAHGMANLGAYEGINGVVRTLYNGDTSLAGLGIGLFQGVRHGIVTGAAMGGVGSIFGEVGAKLGARPGLSRGENFIRATDKAAFQMLGLVGEGFSMHLGEQINSQIEGTGFNLTWEGTLENAIMAGVMKISSPSHYKNFKKNVAGMFLAEPKDNPIRLSADDKRELMKVTNSSSMEEVMTKIFPYGEKADGKATPEQITEAQTRYLEVMNSLSWDAQNKISVALTGSACAARPRTGRFEADGNVLYEYANDGTLLSTHEFKSEEEKNAYVYQKRLHQDNVDFWGTYGKALLRDKDAVIATMTDIARQNGVQDEFVIKAMEKEPIRRTQGEREILRQIEDALHEMAFPKNEVHTEQSAIDGEKAAQEAETTSDTPKTEVVNNVNAEVTQATTEFAEALKDAVWKEDYEELKGKGMSDAEIYKYLIENDLYDKPALAPLAKFVNAQAKQNGFMQGVANEIEQKTSEQTNLVTSGKVTINGVERTDGRVITLVDSDGNIVRLLSGDFKLNEDGTIESEQPIIVSDDSGNPRPLNSVDGWRVAGSTDATEYANYIREILGQKATAVVDPNGEFAQGTAETAAPKETPKETPKAETPKEEPKAETEAEAPKAEVEGTQAVEQTEAPKAEPQQTVAEEKPKIDNGIPLDEKDKKDYVADGVRPVDAVNDIYNRGIFNTEQADAYVQSKIEEARKDFEKKNKPIAPRKGEAPDDYMARLKAHDAEANAAKQVLDRWQAIYDEAHKFDTEEQEAEDAMKTDDIDMTGLENDPRYFIASNMLKITPESFNEQVGLGAREKRAMPGFLAKKENGGVDIFTATDHIMQFLKDQGVNVSEDFVKNTIIDILTQGGPRSYIKNMREEFLARGSKEEAYERAKMDKEYLDNYGMEYDKMVADHDAELKEIEETLNSKKNGEETGRTETGDGLLHQEEARKEGGAGEMPDETGKLQSGDRVQDKNGLVPQETSGREAVEETPKAGTKSSQPLSTKDWNGHKVGDRYLMTDNGRTAEIIGFDYTNSGDTGMPEVLVRLYNRDGNLLGTEAIPPLMFNEEISKWHKLPNAVQPAVADAKAEEGTPKIETPKDKLNDPSIPVEERIKGEKPLTEEEIDNLPDDKFNDVVKTQIKSALEKLKNGDKLSVLEELFYLNALKDVRTTTERGAEDSTDADSAQLASGNNARPSDGGERGEVGNVAGERGGETQEEQLRGQDREGGISPSVGEGGDSQVRGAEPTDGGVSAGTEQSDRGSEPRSEGSNGRGHSDTSRSTQADSDAARAEIKSSIEARKQRLSELAKRIKKTPKETPPRLYDAMSALGAWVGKQIDSVDFVAVGDFCKETLSLGGDYLRLGVHDFKEWARRIKGELGDLLKDTFDWKDAEVDDFIREMWNSKYEMDGEQHTIAEWASIMGDRELRKEIGRDINEKRKQQEQAESIEVKVGDKENIDATLPYLLPDQRGDVLKAETAFFDEKHQDRNHGFGKGMMFTNGTGTGKTYTGLGIVKRFVKQGKGRVLIVTPSQPKVSDWVKDGQNLGLTIKPLENTKDAGEGVVCTTYANLRANEAVLRETFDLIVYDESHKIMENKKGEETIGTAVHYQLSNKNKQHAVERVKMKHEPFRKERELIAESELARKALAEAKDKLNEKEVYYPIKDTEKAVDEEIAKFETDKEGNKEILDLFYTARNSKRRLAEIQDEIEALKPEQEKLMPEIEKEAEEAVKTTKSVFLSATPFNTRESLKYAEGYLFSYPEENKNTVGTYNHRSPEQAFLEQHFSAGYRWRYGRLEQHMENAEALAKQEVQFSDYLQNQLGTLSTRQIDNGYDYSRTFPTVTLDKAESFNQALQDVFNDKTMQPLWEAFHDVFYDYNKQTALFETMKTSLAAERIREHLKRGRKVVVFHRRRTTKDDLQNPFQQALTLAKLLSEEMSASDKQKVAEAISAFHAKYGDLLTWEQNLDYRLPREQLADIFGEENVAFFSGEETTKQKNQAIEQFLKDNKGKDIIVIQEASGKEGISLHDQTGEHQRVQISLCLPQSPIAFIQSEGRIYRIGQKSNAVFEYPLLGLNLEINLWAHKFNNALGTTEYLAMGSKARNLSESIALGIMENSGTIGYDEAGVGGKAYDGNVEAYSATGFDGAITDYFTNQKISAKRENREGKDYFPTPEPLGFKMVEWAGLTEGESALEPSAGHGAIARYVPKSNNLLMIEPSQSLMSKLVLNTPGSGRKYDGGTFEDYNIINKHDAVVMNPPYGVGGATAVEHVAKGFKHLNEGGRLIAIIPDGPACDKKMQAWLESKDAESAVITGEIRLPSCTFGRAGTGVNTRIVLIDKVTREETRKGMPSREEVDLREVKDVNELFEKLRDIDMPERTIDKEYLRIRAAKNFARKLQDPDSAYKLVVSAVVANGRFMRIDMKGRGNSDIWINLEEIQNDPEEAVRRIGLLKDSYNNVDQSWRGNDRIFTMGRGSNKVEIRKADIMRDLYQSAMEFVAKTAGTTVEKLEQAYNEKYGNTLDRLNTHTAQKTEPVEAKPQDARWDYSVVKHTQTGADLHIVKSKERMTDEEYRKELAKAKSLGGFYDRYSKGFRFETKENADKFMQQEGETRFSEELEEPTVRDTEYKKAVEEGDTDSATKILSESFKEAFPNTKVVDKDGEPLVVYHGTQHMEMYFKDGYPYTRYTDPFTVFKEGKGFFTNDKEAAKTFARGKQGLYACYLDMKNPFVYDCKGMDWDRIEGYDNVDNYKYVTTDYIVRDIKTNHPEYDGIIFKNVANENSGAIKHPIDDYIPLKPEQIKSAEVEYDNNGRLILPSERFKSENSDIRFKEELENAPTGDELVSKVLEPSSKELAEFKPTPEGRARNTIYSDGVLKNLRAEIQSVQKEFGRIGNAADGAFYGEDGVRGVADPAKAKDIADLLIPTLEKYKEHLEGLQRLEKAKGYQKVFDEAIADVDKAIKWYTEFGEGKHQRLGEHDEAGIRYAEELKEAERLRMGDKPETFKERQQRAVEQKGVVMPGLNKATVKVVDNIPHHPYTGDIKEATSQAIEAAKAKYAPNGKAKTLHYDNFGAEFDYSISGKAIEALLSPKHQAKSVNKGAHLALAENIDKVISESIEVEEHPDRIKTGDVRDNDRINPDALMHRFYGVARIDGKDYRVMTLMREEGNPKRSNGIHSYEVQKIEVLDEQTPNTSNGVQTPQEKLGGFPLAKVIENVGKTMEKDKNLLEESKLADKLQSEVSKSEDKQAVREQIDTVSKDLNTPCEVHNDISTVNNVKVRQALESGRKVKGWWDKDGVHLYMPNIHSRYDAETTILHESVGHDGLRKVMNGKDGKSRNYQKFLDMVWADKENKALHEFVKKYAPTNNWNLHEAVDEWLAREAEKPISDENFGMWSRVKAMFNNVLRAIGFKSEMNINDVRYAIWLSKRMKQSPNDPLMKARAAAFRWGMEHSNYRPEVKNGRYAVSEKGETRFSAPLTPLHTACVDEYDRQLQETSFKFHEAYTDNMNSLRILQELISGKNYNDIKDAENAYVAENQMSSKSEAAWNKFKVQKYQPIEQAINDCVGLFGGNPNETIGKIEDYGRKKVGLERNRKLLVRDAIEQITDETAKKQMLQKWDIERHRLSDALKNKQIDYRQYLEGLDNFIRANIDKNYDPNKNDYSGISSFDPSRVKHGRNVEFDESAIIDDVMDTETMLGDKAQNFWDAVKDATDFAVDYSYETGMIDSKSHDHIKDMFDFYLPLRGFSEETMEDVYDYIGGNGSGEDLPIRKAKGRLSEAESPLAHISKMAMSAITIGERNKVKQMFYRMVANHPSDAAKVSDMWEVKVTDPTTGAESWEVRMPDIPTDATPKEIADIIDTFVSDMESKKATGDARKVVGKPRYGRIFENKTHASQHIVQANINGKPKMVYVLGNPRAAQALNGELVNKNDSKIRKWLINTTASLATSYSPEFILSNTSRDTLFSRAHIASKENAAYYAKFTKNQIKAGAVLPLTGIGGDTLNGESLFEKYYRGHIDTSKPMEKLFGEFMDNGGRTGFVAMKDIAYLQKELSASVKGKRKRDYAKRIGAALINFFPKAVEQMNMRAELINRFATYMTSREMGRSIQRSVADAKEVSVNFNRKGAGNATEGFIGMTAGAFRNNFMFFNAGMQSAELLYRNLIRGKDKAIKTVMFMGAIPAAVGTIYAMYLAGQDDEEYSNIPSWDRRNNICIPIKDLGGYAKIPLPIELRAFWGMGDIAASLTYKRLQTEESPEFAMLGQITQMFPVDFLEGGERNMTEISGYTSLLPTYTQPMAQYVVNKSWTGKPIEKESKFNPDAPHWTRAYDSTNGVLIEICKYAHDKFRKGKEAAQETDTTGDSFLIDPSMYDHLLKSYFSGAYSMLGKTINTASRKLEGGDIDWSHAPMASRVWGGFSEQEADATTNAKYWSYKREYDNVSKEYSNEANKTNPLAITELGESERGKRYHIFKAADKELKKLQKTIKNSDDPDKVMQAKKRQNELRRDLVDALDNVE